MENKNIKIEELEKRLEELRSITKKSFDSSLQLKEHVDSNKQFYEEAREIHQQIENLKYESMTPKEKEKAEKRERFLELKAKGEPFDISEFDDLND